MRDELSLAVPAIAFVVASIALLASFLLFGYYDYVHDSSYERACDEAYGEDADWIGSTVTTDGEVGLCETADGDLRRVGPPEDYGGSFVAYLESLAGEFGRLSA